MNEHADGPRRPLRVVEALGREFDRASQREAKSSWRRHAPRGRRAVALAAAGGLLAAGGAAAAIGIPPVGSVFRGEGFEHNEQGVDETVVATGTAPVAGRWQLTFFRSARTEARGEVLEPAGLPCIKLKLLDPGSENRFGGGGFCGATPTFIASHPSVNLSDPGADGVILLFGRAPDQATAVELTADGGKQIRAETQGPQNVPARYWLIAAPPGLKNARVTWLDKDGNPGDTRDVSYPFQPPAAP